MKFKFTGSVDPQTGQAPGVYILTDQMGSLDPALECIFEHHFAKPGLYKSMDRAMLLVLGSCVCHLFCTDVRLAVVGVGNGYGAGDGVGVGVNVDEEDVLEEDEVFGTVALLLYRANLRHPLVKPNSVLDALLNSTRGTELSGDRQLRYGWAGMRAIMVLFLKPMCLLICLRTSYFWFVVGMNVRKRLTITQKAGASTTLRFFSLSVDPLVTKLLAMPMLVDAGWAVSVHGHT